MTLALRDPNDRLVVQLTPTSSVDAIVNWLDPGRVAYVDPGLGGVQLEFVGPASAPGLRAWMDADFDRIIVARPPWES